MPSKRVVFTASVCLLGALILLGVMWGQAPSDTAEIAHLEAPLQAPPQLPAELSAPSWRPEDIGPAPKGFFQSPMGNDELSEGELPNAFPKEWFVPRDMGRAGGGKGGSPSGSAPDSSPVRTFQPAEPSETPSSTPTPEPFVFNEEVAAEIMAQSEEDSARAGREQRWGGAPGSGRATSSGGGAFFPGDSSARDSKIEGDEQEELLPFARGQARGYAMLYLMESAARPTVERQIQTLLDSRVGELFLGVLTDGTFGKDFAYLADVVHRLNEGGRTLTLVLYLTNGSTMRRHDTTPITAGFNRIEPEEFRDLIRFDTRTREQFVQMVREVQPIFELNRALNPFNSNIAVVMLEDNLTVESYRAMRSLAQSVLGSTVEYGRNPCEGCYPGNDSDPDGDLLELHDPRQTSRLRPGDGFTLDGTGYTLGAHVNDTELSAASVETLMLQLMNQGTRYFGLWRESRQGLRGADGAELHPQHRTYEVPSDVESLREQSLLRVGLVEDS